MVAVALAPVEALVVLAVGVVLSAEPLPGAAVAGAEFGAGALGDGGGGALSKHSLQ